jgi:large subunit ribosomal protein L3
MLGLLGKKLGMTQVFGEDGALIPVTAVEVGPCTVVQRKLIESDGYNAVQLGFGRTGPKGMPKARRGHFEKKGLPLFTHLCEFRTERAKDFNVGDEITAAAFKAGDVVHVAGTSKGRGFQGVIKRHGKHGGPAAHGSDFHRRPGSIGMRTWPGRVPKNMKLPGHMGDERVTVQGLAVVAVRPTENVVLIKGALPGRRGGLLTVTPADISFETRPELTRSAAQAAPSEEAPAATAETKE